MTDPHREPARPPSGPFGSPGIGRYLRGPEGLRPLSRRPRDVAIRWLSFAAVVIVLLAFIAVMLIAGRT